MDSFLSSEYASLDQLYVNTAVRGLLPARTVAKLTEMGKVLTTPDFDWRTANDEDAATIRQSFAALCGEDSGVKAEDVVIAASGASASALLARNLMVDGTVVVGLSNDFSSLIAPIVHEAKQHSSTRVHLVDSDLTSCEAVTSSLLSAITGCAADAERIIVAVSHVQSATGAVTDVAAIEAALPDSGFLIIDTTQSRCAVPVPRFQRAYTITSLYKWCVCPKGLALVTLPSDRRGIVLTNYSGINWTNGPKVDKSGYWYSANVVEEAAAAAAAAPVPAAALDMSHSWLLNAVAAASLSALADVGITAILERNGALARRARARLPADKLLVADLPEHAPILVLKDVSPDGWDGIASVRQGRLRLAFHFYNRVEDVDAVCERLGC
jgi:selenocysteine lyase/cysteine desulfurase